MVDTKFIQYAKHKRPEKGTLETRLLASKKTAKRQMYTGEEFYLNGIVVAFYGEGMQRNGETGEMSKHFTVRVWGPTVQTCLDTLVYSIIMLRILYKFGS